MGAEPSPVSSTASGLLSFSFLSGHNVKTVPAEQAVPAGGPGRVSFL